MAAIINDVDTMEYASVDLENDKIFVLKTVKTNGLALKYADDSLKSDKKIILESIKQDVKAYQYVDKELQNDFEIKQYYNFNSAINNDKKNTIDNICICSTIYLQKRAAILSFYLI